MCALREFLSCFCVGGGVICVCVFRAPASWRQSVNRRLNAPWSHSDIVYDVSAPCEAQGPDTLPSSWQVDALLRHPEGPLAHDSFTNSAWASEEFGVDWGVFWGWAELANNSHATEPPEIAQHSNNMPCRLEFICPVHPAKRQTSFVKSRGNHCVPK